MNHPLPPRPNFIPSLGGPSKPSTILPTPTAPAAPIIKPTVPRVDPTKCSSCSSPQPKYTCPRCSKRSCSLECSKKHKAVDDCSGVRDPTSFVPLTAYGQGAWSDDYKWLEEGRRKVTQWGENVGYHEMVNATKKPSKHTHTEKRKDGKIVKKRNTKKDLLKRELLMGHSCHMEYMPMGMERRKLNQSSWNPRTKQLHITIHLTIPTCILDPPSSSQTKTIAHTRVLFSSPSADKSSLPTLSSLLTPPPSTSSNIIYVLPFQSTPSRPAPDHTKGQKLFYSPLDPLKPIAEALGGTSWVEFPIIELMEKTKWDEGLQQGEFVVVPLSQPPIALRSKDSGWGKRNIESLDGEKDNVESPKKAKIDGKGLMALGDYGSDDEDDVDDDLDDQEEEEEDVADESTLEGDQDDEREEGDGEEPSMEVLQAVGAALVADLAGA
ncbi:hypothetical protein V866_006409 [Kwoniella sp. B9012]|uniref:HIT-type domain-containing protein n=1 Tax=Kwoniella europaea PYCC6329 TaxID=1423913 RepID=A0AAX4KSN2_9TREE